MTLRKCVFAGAAAVAAASLAGCADAPYYGYNDAPYYGYNNGYYYRDYAYDYPYYYGPSVSLGLAFNDEEHHHWRHHDH